VIYMDATGIWMLVLWLAVVAVVGVVAAVVWVSCGIRPRQREAWCGGDIDSCQTISCESHVRDRMSQR